MRLLNNSPLQGPISRCPSNFTLLYPYRSVSELHLTVKSGSLNRRGFITMGQVLMDCRSMLGSPESFTDFAKIAIELAIKLSEKNDRLLFVCRVYNA